MLNAAALCLHQATIKRTVQTECGCFAWIRLVFCFALGPNYQLLFSSCLVGVGVCACVSLEFWFRFVIDRICIEWSLFRARAYLCAHIFFHQHDKQSGVGVDGVHVCLIQYTLAHWRMIHKILYRKHERIQHRWIYSAGWSTSERMREWERQRENARMRQWHLRTPSVCVWVCLCVFFISLRLVDCDRIHKSKAHTKLYGWRMAVAGVGVCFVCVHRFS